MNTEAVNAGAAIFIKENPGGPSLEEFALLPEHFKRWGMRISNSSLGR